MNNLLVTLFKQDKSSGAFICLRDRACGVSELVLQSAAYVMLAFLVLAVRPVAAQEPEAEIKLFVEADKIGEARKRVEERFAPGGPKRHEIYFFDTGDLQHYKNGDGPVILRARQKQGKKPQSTVKFRRAKRDPALETKLLKVSSKLEIQTESILGKDEEPGISYALDAKIEDKELAELNDADGAKIAGWFSPEQKKFLEAAGIVVDWQKLNVFGRVDAEVWEWTAKIGDESTELTAEAWRLGDRQIFEFSCKKPGGNLAKHVEEFGAFFKGHQIAPAKNPQSKTKQALDHFGKKVSAASPTGFQEIWHKIGDGKLMGISGMALLSQEGDELTFLVVHDNKKDNESRAGMLKRKGRDEPTYMPLQWPGPVEDHPKDLEAITSIPGMEGEYLTTTSRGSAFRIKLNETGHGIDVIAHLMLPWAKETSEIEGLALAKIGSRIVAIWGDRGDGETPAELSWSEFDLAAGVSPDVQSAKMRVPWPEREARDISDIRIDPAGVVFVSAAFESNDDAADASFASAIYVAGVIDPESDRFGFRQNRALTRLYQFDGRKIEALELLPGRDGGLIFGTDDETQGSSVFFSW